MASESQWSGLSWKLVLSAGLLWLLGASSVQAAVGRTQGSFNVSASGAATYSIPIFAPAGVGGLQPSIALVYNSNSGPGYVGQGWSLSGLSSIKQCNHTVAQDGYAWANGRYCLNGNRLRVQSGTYGASGSVYATEIADFSRITLTGTVATTGYWTVEGKDGLIYTYGGTTDSRPYRVGFYYWFQVETSEWKLSEIRDRSGNKVRFTWGLATATAHPVKIEWTQTSASSGSYVYSMDFSYGTNSPSSTATGYLPGFGSYGDAALLSGITVSVSGTVKRNYVLTYDTSPSTDAKRLTRVKECSDSGAADCLSPTDITYQDGTVGLDTGSPTTVSGASIHNADYDFNGDGIKDLSYEVSGTHYVKMGSVSSGYGSPISTGIPHGYWAGRLLGNHADQILGQSGGVWYVHYWNGSSFSSTSTGISTSAMSGSIVVSDVNGDGLDDLFYTTGTSPGGYAWTGSDWEQVDVAVRLNTTTGGTLSFASPAASYSGTYSSPYGFPTLSGPHYPGFYMSIVGYSAWKGGDVNGDGAQDVAMQLVVSWCSSTTYECGGHVEYRSLQFNQSGYVAADGFVYDPSFNPVNAAVSPYDFNADGCSDYVVYDTFSTVGMSDCYSVVADQFTASIPMGGYFPWAPPSVVDWDGDGRKDFISPNNVSGYYDVTPFYGTSTGTPVSTGISLSADCWMFVTDGNGDGLDDLGCHDMWGSGFAVYLHNGVNVAPDLATEFEDGFGVSYVPTYTAIERGTNYTGYTNAPANYRDVRSDRRVVSQAQATDGVGGTYTTTYNYFGALINLKGRGFVGFEKLESVDSRTGIKRVQKFKREFPYSGMPFEESIYQSASGPLMNQRTTTATYTTLDATAYNERFFPYVSASTEDVYEVGGTRDTDWITNTAVSYTFDTSGNLTASTKVVTDKDSSSPLNGDTWTTTSSQTIYPNSTYWCLGLPSAVSVTRSSSVSGETTVYDSKGFSPDYVNCRQDAESVGSGALQVDTNYSYDGFGNVDSVSVTGRNPNSSSMSARTANITWGSPSGTTGGTGQFPVQATNALSQTTTRTFDSTFGSLLTETDPNGIVVANNTYDTFGRFGRTDRPDGTYETYTYALLSGCCNPNGIDYVLTTSYDSGNNPIRHDYVFRDQFGRMVNEYHDNSSGSGYWTNARSYDSLGRVDLEGMPFLTSGGSQYTPTFVTSHSYDLLGRVTSQSRPSNDGPSPVTVTTSFTYEGRKQTIIDPYGKDTIKVADVNGRMRRSEDDNGYYQNFSYDAAGNLKQVADASDTLFSATYVYGIKAFQDATSDMDLGAWSYTYNSLGELVEWTDAKSQAFNQTYDALSRVTSREDVVEGRTSYWVWGSNSGAYNIGKLDYVLMPGQMGEYYTYDNKGRLSVLDVESDQHYYIDYAYNNQGLLDSLTYPTSTSSTRVKVKHGYSYGILQSVTDWTSGSAGTVYWTADSKNPRGQTTQETLGNGVVTTRNFDAVTGRLNYIQSGTSGGGWTSLQNQSFAYDMVGNVTQRQESTQGLTENFYYDNLYRLDYSQLNSTTNLDLTYDASGNITARSDVNGNATWTYHSTKKHAVATTGSGGTSFSYDANGNMTSRAGQTISWSSFNYPTALATATESTQFYYGPDRQYWRQAYIGPSGTETTHYVGGILEKVTAGGVTDWRHSIVAEGQVVAIVSRKSSSTNAVYYPLEDNQGSGSVLTDSSGTNLVRQSYNAFGLPRDGADWDGAVPSGDKTTINGISRRGYTGHSMLGDMGLIHMNGRVQDAITGRFLSPDPNIPNPGLTQSYNRYAYVNNSPLSFTDPSGFKGGPNYEFQSYNNLRNVIAIYCSMGLDCSAELALLDQFDPYSSNWMGAAAFQQQVALSEFALWLFYTAKDAGAGASAGASASGAGGLAPANAAYTIKLIFGFDSAKAANSNTVQTGINKNIAQLQELLNLMGLDAKVVPNYDRSASNMNEPKNGYYFEPDSKDIFVNAAATRNLAAIRGDGIRALVTLSEIRDYRGLKDGYSTPGGVVLSGQGMQSNSFVLSHELGHRGGFQGHGVPPGHPMDDTRHPGTTWETSDDRYRNAIRSLRVGP